MGHALNGAVQDCLVRYNRMLGQAHALDARHRPRGDRHADAGREAPAPRGQLARGDRPRGVHRARLALARGVRRDHLQAVPAPRGLVRLRRGALHARRELRARGAQGLRRPLRQGPDLPRQPDRQLGSRLALGDLRPRGRGARGHRHALLRRLPDGLGRRLGHRRHGAAGDDARRHRDRGASRRPALHAADRRDRDPAARRPPAADHRRPVREAGVRHGRAEDHARARPQRLRDRPRARARGARRDRRGRRDVGGGRRALRRHDRARGAGGRRGGAARGGSDRAHGALHARGAVLAPLGRADRAADLAPVVHGDGGAGAAGDRRGPRRQPARAPGEPAQALPGLARGDPALVHLAPALVGPSDPGLVPRRGRHTSA